MVRAISLLVVRTDMTLAETIRLWRGQSASSPTPNKALVHDHFPWLLHEYEHVNLLIRTATQGVKHVFQVDGTQQTCPVPNHKSAAVMRNALVRSIRDGQRSGAYLVVSRDAASRWRLHYSPFGCVEKADADPAVEARVIHDLSFPLGDSTNAWSDQLSIPTLVYELVDIIAHRIIALRKANPTLIIKIMKGDVTSAYKNLHVHEDVSAFFAGSLPDEDVTIIDLALPFGWTGSAAHYGVFGKAISHLVRRESPNTLDPTNPDTTPFFCFDWVDDHVLVEYETSDRLQACDSALRLAMTAVLGPRAINNKKFTEWSANVVALGLEWDSVAMTVSIPVSKLQKALGRVEAVLGSSQTTRTALAKLLGSLRHVRSCIRPAKPFFQQLVALWKRSPRIRPISLTPEARLDLAWFAHILRFGRLRGVPLEYFCGLPAPVVHLYMDASDSGLCVLNPVRHEFIRLQFDPIEQDLIKQRRLSINVREQFSALVAVLCWGKHWRSSSRTTLTHVRFWIDNAAAVTWCNKLTSTNPLSQEMNRFFGAVEAEWSLRVSAEHLAGSSNFLADLGSRAWSDPQLTLWNKLTNDWTQVKVPDSMRKAYDGSWSPFNNAPLPIRPGDNTTRLGSNGFPSVGASDVLPGSQNTTKSRSLSNWCFLPSIDGRLHVRTDESDLPPPCTPKLAMSSGIIKSMPGLNPSSAPATPQRSQECDASALLLDPDLPSLVQCSSGCPPKSTSRNPSNASFLGLRCWVSSISYCTGRLGSVTDFTRF